MKPFVDPTSRPIDSPVDDDLNESYLNETDIPADSFENEQSTSVADDSIMKFAASQP